MSYEVLPNEQVLAIEELDTGTQVAIIKKPIGMLKRIVLEAPKVNVSIGEEMLISLHWQVFNLKLGRYEPDVNNHNSFEVMVREAETGTIRGRMVINDVENGTSQLVFSSDEPGRFIVVTTVPKVDNDEIEVIVNG